MITNIDSALTLQEKLRLWLGEHHEKYVPLTTEEIADKLGVNRHEAYQTVARLKARGEIEVDKSDDNKIIGISIIKLEPSSRTYHRAAERAKSKVDNHNAYTDTVEKMTALKSYLDKKLAIIDMQERAKEAGLPIETVVFEPNPYAEEGLLLLNLLGDTFKELKETKDALQMAEYDRDAAKRDVEFMKRQRKEDTRDYLASTPN